MIGNRSLFVFTCLFLVMVMNVSTVPIEEPENEGDIVKEIIGTTFSPDVVTDNLLFFDRTDMPLAGDVDTKDLLFKQGFQSITPVSIDEVSVTPSE